MKESPRRYTNPFLSDDEDEKDNLWNNQEHQHSNIEDGLTNICETKLYTDKNVLECDMPELLVCYKTGTFHVKDICVDEGIQKEKILFDENNNEILKPKPYKLPLNGKNEVEDYCDEPSICSGTNDKNDTSMPIPESTNDHIDVEDNRDKVDADLIVTGDVNNNSITNNISIDADISNQDLQNLQLEKDCVDDVHEECGTNEEAIDSVVSNELKTVSKCESLNENEDEDGTFECAPDKIILHPEADTALKATEKYDIEIRSSDKLLDNSSTKQIDINGAPAPDMQQTKPLPSLKSLLESFDQLPCQSPVEEILKSTNISNESPKEELNNTLNINNIKSEAILNNTVYRGEGESSFSVAGPVSGRITYSGPIAFSGSISLRSDSSTTSTRSFAFPILPNEWNSSPVRMAKADRRRLHKHRGWRYGFLCCRF